ncbi:helix-turn-helix domain-containing protein [Actinokineospora soli]
MFDITVIDDRAAAEVWLDPIRAKLLAELTRPGSATTLAGQLGIPRQKVNYHLRTLEKHGLVSLVEERRKGNMTERVVQATAGSYVISPDVVPELAPDPGKSPDRLSARWLLALAGRLVRDVGSLITKSTAAGKKLATFAVDGEVRFATPQDRADFAAELGDAVTALIAKYHSETGRAHRVVVAVHPEAD